MAVTRVVKEFTIDLKEIIKARLDNFVNIRKNILARQEADFQRRVMDEDLSLEEQLKFREKQLTDEKAKTYPYLEFIEEVEDTISSLKKLIRYKKRRDKYFDMFSDYSLGKASTETMIKFLEDQITTTNDTKIIEELQKDLLDLKAAKTKEEITILNNKIKLFEKDKSLSLYDEIIGDIDKKRSEALAVGNLDLVSSYDVTLASLKDQKTHIIIENKIADFEFAAIKEDWQASQKLNYLNTLISQANSQNEITVNGIKFSSERAYWETQRNSYLAGVGSGILKNFLDEFQTEKENQIIVASAFGQFQSVPATLLHSIDNEYKALATKPEFAPYVNALETYRLSTLATGLDKIIKGVTTEAKAFGRWTEAETAIQKLQAEFGIDLTSSLLDLKESQIGFYATYPKEELWDIAGEIATEKGTTQEEEYEKLTGFKAEPKVTKPIIQPTVPTKEAEKSDMDKILAEVRAKKTAYTASPFNREQYIEDLTERYTETYRQFIIDTVYRELRLPTPREPAYEPPKYEVYQPPTPAPAPTPPSPPPAPKETKVEIPFPTTQAQMEEYLKKEAEGEYIKPTKVGEKWYQIVK
jgi:hypothetical protein